MGKRLVIIISILLVVLAFLATVFVIVRARSSRVAQPPASSEPATSPSSDPGGPPASSSKPPAAAAGTQGILPREKDSPLIGESKIAITDTDGDGLRNDEEAFFGSDPNRKDTDGDGLSDFEETRRYCTDPTKVSTDGKAQDKAWVDARKAEAASAGQRAKFCVN